MKRPRLGLSRLELLVAAAIAGIAATLLLPAVQKLRMASQRSTCVNNLHKIGEAFQSYHTTKRRLPPGGGQTPAAGAACVATPNCREREWSWAYHILPYLGYADTHRNPDAAAVLNSPIPEYYCPTRRRTRCYNNRAMLDYAANAGTKADGSNGAIMHSNAEPITISEISDGAASTVLVAEKRLNVAELGNSPGDREGYAAPGWTTEAYRLGNLAPAPDLHSPGDLTAFTEFGSSHPGAINALFADGTVRTIRFTVDPAIWRRACIRNDNQAFNLNDL